MASCALALPGAGRARPESPGISSVSAANTNGNSARNAK